MLNVHTCTTTYRVHERKHHQGCKEISFELQLLYDVLSWATPHQPPNLLLMLQSAVIWIFSKTSLSCLLDKWRTETTSPMAKSTSPACYQTGFSLHTLTVLCYSAMGYYEALLFTFVLWFIWSSIISILNNLSWN